MPTLIRTDTAGFPRTHTSVCLEEPRMLPPLGQTPQDSGRLRMGSPEARTSQQQKRDTTRAGTFRIRISDESAPCLIA